jgi:chorismate synthase
MLDVNQVQRELDRRRPGQSAISTTRFEEDRLELLSGIYAGYTTGAPITMLIRNRDQDSSKYDEIRWTPRPGHADYSAYTRYAGFNDYRGGGRFSGRITAGFVMAGAVAKQLLANIGVEVLAFTSKVGSVEIPSVTIEEIRTLTESSSVRCPHKETSEKMFKVIENTKIEEDSIGGSINCIVLGLPAGIGQPVFDTLEGDLAKALFSIPSVKAVEFGLGKGLTELRGSESNDDYKIEGKKIITTSNNAGGISGGISNGMPLTLCATFKPTPSISQIQNTINLQTFEDAKIKVVGRHDPCIVPRAVPVVEAVTATVIVDHALRCGIISQVMEKLQ